MLHPLFAGGVLDEMSAAAREVATDPTLAPVWDRLAEHVQAMVCRGWRLDDARAAIAGAVLLPVELGHAEGRVNRQVRAGIDMRRRRKAAALALRLADMLHMIEREPLPPDEVISVASIVAMGDRLPTYALTYRPAEALRRLAAGLERAPDLAEAPGLASRKPGWRDAVREAVGELRRHGFALREAEAVRLAAAYCRATGQCIPTRENVHAALRPLATPGNRSG